MAHISNGGKKRAPAGLSRWARGEWEALQEDHEFCRFELVILERAFRYFDLSDTLLRTAEAEGLLKGGKPHQALAAHRDAAQTALRYWRALGFKDDPHASRRPGRPSGDAWSPARKAGASAYITSLQKGRQA